MLETKSSCFLLAEIAVELRKHDSTDWSTIVKALETLEENGQDNALQFPAKLKILAALQQDAADMLQIPREHTAKLHKFLYVTPKLFIIILLFACITFKCIVVLIVMIIVMPCRDVMKEAYDGDFPHIYNTIQDLVEAYQQGTEKDFLQRKPFARDRIVTKFNSWLTHVVTTLRNDATVTNNNDDDDNNADTTESKQRTARGETKRKRHTAVLQETTRERLQELRHARGKLSQAVVVDPLEEIRKASRLAARGGAQLYTKKSSARKLEFSDDEEIEEPEEEDDEVHATHELSEIPARLKPRRPRDPSPDRSVESSAGKKRWTQEQKTAFVSALREYGVGNWAAIRDSQHYRKYWSNRNNVQLKDLFRTMKQGGHIPEDML